ncbi:MAG: ABC transporter substrate-binding protein, partial [Pseudomonadota bacterium]|nr:ABC transporter substrate-binding protein [Pseudomonadota bacterium]
MISDRSTKARWLRGLLAGAAALLASASAQAQTPVRFSLDWRWEGPAAPFAVALDKDYFKAEGLDVTIDPAAGSREPISRVASGTYDAGFGDVNSLVRFRDENPGTDIKAVMVIYDRPPFAIIGRKSRGVSKE